MLFVFCAVVAAIFPRLVVARARVLGTTPLIKGELIDTNGSSTVSINVAGDQLVFIPPNANATVGQVVNFMFPSDIPVSVTQSSFNDPCTYLNTPTETGFDSQLQQSVIFTLEILDDDPIWFHCKHPGHCGQGMVGSINAPTGGNQTFTIYQQTALRLGSNAPNDTNSVTVIAGGSSAAVGTALTSTSSTRPSVAPTATNDAGSRFMMLRARVWCMNAWLLLAYVMVQIV